ncbi:hypothetical protein [Kibdelosporangium phytohabitans]|uniref:hypothetical protein n=1 Tax=Kibdelosporangium phytohabitans TaxID=860235 RepID=UPI0019E19187|nr:hypothetical protein [Kibdelosporangium phytohabitans]
MDVDEARPRVARRRGREDPDTHVRRARHELVADVDRAAPPGRDRAPARWRRAAHLAERPLGVYSSSRGLTVGGPVPATAQARTGRRHGRVAGACG